jgi:hypothetical protein
LPGLKSRRGIASDIVEGVMVGSGEGVAVQVGVGVTVGVAVGLGVDVDVAVGLGVIFAVWVQVGTGTEWVTAGAGVWV